MSSEKIIVCRHCGGKNRMSNKQKTGIPACGHCKKPLSDTPLRMGKSSPTPQSPSTNQTPPQKGKTIQILLVVLVVLIILNLIKEFSS